MSMRFSNRQAFWSTRTDSKDRRARTPIRACQRTNVRENREGTPTFQHTDRSPSSQGLGPSGSLTACRRSTPIASSGTTIFQRFLTGQSVGSESLGNQAAYSPSFLERSHRAGAGKCLSLSEKSVIGRWQAYEYAEALAGNPGCHRND